MEEIDEIKLAKTLPVRMDVMATIEAYGKGLRLRVTWLCLFSVAKSDIPT